MRTEYISLLHLVLLNSNYSECKHQARELLVCLNRISNEEDKESEQDKLIVQENYTQKLEECWNFIYPTVIFTI